MELEFNPRPLSIVHRTRQWHDHSPLTSGPSAPPSSFISASLSHNQRRRSSAANFPPAGPPPSQPIPNVPPTSAAFSIEDTSPMDDAQYMTRHRSSTSNSQNSTGRPAASASLAAVAAFTQSRQASASTSHSPQSSSSTIPPSPDLLSDPPPPSMLHISTSRAMPHSQDIVPDRLLLSPPQPRSPSESRPSSRRALTRALELAREAVQLDSTNDDPHAAVMAYGRSVALLGEVMERVRRGEDSTETGRRRGGRRRSVVAQEEEVRRLKSIHDTYADRMNILSLIYSIPPIPHSPSSVYTASASTESTQPPTPTSLSPASDSHRSSIHITEHTQDDPQHPNAYGEELHDEHDAHEGIGSAMFALDSTHISQGSPRTPSAPSPHPYAAISDSLIEPVELPPAQSSSSLNRTSTLPAIRTPHQASYVGRPRAASVLPPPAPPPASSPPPPPPDASTSPIISSNQPTRFLEVTRSRGNSISHKRTGSGSRLAAVDEDVQLDAEPDMLSLPRRPDTPRTAKRESHPLPPLPSPSPANSVSIPRNHSFSEPPSSPIGAQFASPRPRGESLTATSNQHLINNTIAMGSIVQRRSKMSAPPSTTTQSSSSPTDSITSSTFVHPPPRTSGSPHPPSSITSIGVGRSRASSQPGRRPSIVNGRISPFGDQRPPMPQSANGVAVPRKASYPSKLNPNISVQLPSLIIHNDILSPPSAMGLVPPLPMSANNIPTTPTSPLPPAAPSDGQRKPYHLMNLLSITMSSRTGGYITRRLHVPQEVWSQGGAKLANIPEKVRVVEVLCSALEDLQQSSAEYFGAGSVCSGLALGIGSVGRDEAEAWVGKLEEFSQTCDNVVANFGKKLGVGEGFVLKKTGGVTSWGGKLTRRIDKFTNGKTLDSPAAYVAGLGRLFSHAQLIDEHTKALLSQPVAPIYAAFPPDVRSSAEVKLKRASEFFASVVLTFVIQDLAQLLDKFAKQREKWLGE
ncbi:hypothetical protein BJ138DRAFT_1122704 [Hygrophoropsis aurantiaca]|uniref:Uncharacterized protein n=1 Tax=Hygrophoropsis aurantiaca TaxID=72124 RepID=A0ACB8AQ65_9AGAM|nr:hypothetical protein BJ138DRAFT_1122704 [Hygrophoropsis aurantiaca]